VSPGGAAEADADGAGDEATGAAGGPAAAVELARGAVTMGGFSDVRPQAARATAVRQK
jgi:hypothetical protein